MFIGLRSQFWSRIYRFFALACVALLLVVSCSSGPGAVKSNAPNGEQIAIGTTFKLRTLDPADAYDIFAGILLTNMGERLYTYELGSTTIKPQLATAMPDVSNDGLVYKIPLREGVLFHDGAQFNARAMEFSLRRFIENGGGPSHLLADVVKSVEATADYELTLTLKQPFAALPALLSFSGACAVSPQRYEIGANKFVPDQFVGTGPYKLVSYGSDLLQLGVFDRYWGEKPANQGVFVQSFTTPSNLFSAFQTGEIDVAYQTFEPEQVKTLLQDATTQGWQTIAAQGNGVTYLVLNTQKAPVDNVAVRRAIAALINRPLMKERVFQDQAEPLYSLIPTTFDVYAPIFQERYGDGDVAIAKKYLTEAGYSSDNPLKLDLWYPSNSPERSLIASLLQAFAKEELDGAIQLEQKPVDRATGYSNLAKGSYPTFLATWFPDFIDPDNYMQPFLTCDQGSATTGCQQGTSQARGSFYFNNTAQKLIDEQRSLQDPQKRQTIFKQLQDIVATDVPYIPLMQNKEYAFAQKGITGVQISPTQQFPFWTVQRQSE